MEGGEELNWRDQDIAVCLKLNFVTNVEIILWCDNIGGG